MKLNLGCGTHVCEGWVNVDYALGARMARVPLFGALNRRLKLFDIQWDPRIHLHDLTTPFPWADGSVDVVYSSHALEHFTRDDGRRFLEESHRVLRPGGIIRIVVPDLRCTIDDYLAGRLPAEDVLESLDVLLVRSRTAWKNYLAAYMQFPHKCMYDTPALVRILGAIGFDAGSRGAFDSGIDDIRVIELEPRTRQAVIVEGRKR